MKDFQAKDNTGVRALCLEARHSISREIAKKRRQRFESSIFIPKIYSRNISPFEMAMDDGGFRKSNRDSSKPRSKPPNSTYTKRTKQFLDKKRVQHPESFPLSKKRVTKQVLPEVESFRGSDTDMKHHKDYDMRNQRTLFGKDCSRSATQTNGKLSNLKFTRNHSVDGDFTSSSLPDKFMMKVFKVKSGMGNTISASDTNLISSGIPNFVLCCTSNSFAIKQEERNRGGASTSKEKSSNLDVKAENDLTKKESPMSETKPDDLIGSEILQKTEELTSHTDPEESVPNTSQPSDLTTNVNADAEADANAKGQESETDQNQKDLEHKICVCCGKIKCTCEPIRPTKCVEFQSTDCEDSSDDQGESDDCQQEGQNHTTVCCHNANVPFDYRPMCTCYCCPLTQREIQMNSPQNWLQMQNRNQMFSYPLCCPDGSGYYRCGCGCSPIAPLSSVMAPPSMQTMQSIPPSSQMCQPQQFVAQTNSGNPNGQPLIAQNTENLDFPSNHKSELRREIESTDEENTQEATGRVKKEKSPRVNKKASPSRTPKNAKSKKRSAPPKNLSREENISSPQSNMSGTGFEQSKANSRKSQSARDSMPGPTQPVQNPPTWRTPNNTFNCYTPNPYCSCNMCPPYHTNPWGFPWWYTGFPLSFDPYCNPMAAAGINSLHPMHTPMPMEHSF